MLVRKRRRSEDNQAEDGQSGPIKRVLFFTGVCMRTNLFSWAKMKMSCLPEGTTKFNVESEEGKQNLKAFLEPVGDIVKAKARSTDETVSSTQNAT